MEKIKKNAVIITGPGFEDVEVTYPFYRLQEEGFNVEIATNNAVKVIGKHGQPIEKIKQPIDATKLKAENYDLLIIPGGNEAPDRVRQVKSILEFVAKMNKQGKPIASICHGPWVLISSGIIKGKKATCYTGMVDDLKNAGAKYYDQTVVQDDNIITSRHPKDLTVWMKKTIEVFNARSKK